MDLRVNGSQKKRVIKRHRELRACTECRKRKLKCDHKQPCNSCMKRNEVSTCVYKSSFGSTRIAISEEHERRSQAEARLEHLEKLVQELSHSKQTAEAIDGPTNNVPGQRSMNDVSYSSFHNGATHWSAMLEDIEGLRNALGEQDESEDSDAEPGEAEAEGMSLLLGAGKPFTYDQIIDQYLPARPEADRIVAGYFRRKASMAPFIHGAQFMRLYRLFWDDPSSVSPLWVSILFSIFFISAKILSMSSKHGAGGSSKVDRFGVAAASCLTIGEYYKPQEFAVEALLLYASSICFASVDIPPTLGVLMGTLTRLATTMGYHRESPESHRGLSVFDREMRRRARSMLMQIDLLVSFQLGLPSNVQCPTWEMEPPTNLLDYDLDENMLQLPEARPDSQSTELSFYIAKHKIMTSFEKILRHTLSATDKPVEELEIIEQELRDNYEALPPMYQSRSLTDSVVDPPSVIVTRICVEFIYQKSLCVLHRPYIIRKRIKSIQKCHAAASALAGQFLDFYDAFEPGGQLETEKWLMGGITWHDFFLCCSTLCLILYSTRKNASDVGSGPIIDVEGTLRILQAAKDIFERHHSKSGGTRKIQRLLEATILRFSGQTKPGAQGWSQFGEDQILNDDWQTTIALPSDEEWVWNMSNMTSGEDASWAFVEQYLDLPNETMDASHWIGMAFRPMAPSKRLLYKSQVYSENVDNIQLPYRLIMDSHEVVLCTGANTGLGYEIIRALCGSAKAYDILLAGRSESKVAEAVKSAVAEFPASKSKLWPIQVDIENDDSIHQAFEEVQEKFGRLDVLVNNAGAMFDQQLRSGAMTMRQMWNQSWAVNTTGTQVMTSIFMPLLLKSKNPRLLFITSGTSTLAGTENGTLFVDKSPPQGWPKNDPSAIAAYRSSKTGMNMMMRQWYRTLKEDGVKVWCISPGYLATGLGAGQEANKGFGAGDPSLGGAFVLSVVEGQRDGDVGKVIRKDDVQSW